MADLIKKVKIKKQDGTFTDYIPIGVEAENVNVDGESVETKLNKMPYYYNSVADMKADENLKISDMAITLGYYEANDGGAGEYRIVNGNYTDDGGSYHELENNLFAELIIKDSINIKQFGAYGDGIHNDTDSIQNAINLGFNIFIPKGTFLTTELNCSSKTIIRGEGKANSIIKAFGSSLLNSLLNASENLDGFEISKILLNGKNLCQNGVIAGNRNNGFTSSRRININDISIINCIQGLYVGGVSATVDNISIVNCNNGILVESYGVIITNSVISKCSSYGIKLSNGNGYITNNKIYLNNIGLIVDGLAYSICNNNIQQNYNSGIVFTENANSNILNENINLANGYYENDIGSNIFEIELNGINNKISGIIVSNIMNWKSKVNALIKNVDGFNNTILINTSTTLDKTLYKVNPVINDIEEIFGYNISNEIYINNVKKEYNIEIATITSYIPSGDNITTDLTDNIETITLSNAEIEYWPAKSSSDLQGAISRFIPTNTNINGIYVLFDVELSKRINNLGIGHYLSYKPTGTLTPIDSILNIKNNYNPLSNKHKVLLYTTNLDPNDTISYFNINNKFVNPSNETVTVDSISAIISNIRYITF